MTVQREEGFGLLRRVNCVKVLYRETNGRQELF